MLKTKAEIDYLKSQARSYLNQDGDDLITSTEFEKNAFKIADDLDDFHIETYDDLKFYFTKYCPGTNVRFHGDIGSERSKLRAIAKDAYDNGQLMDMALSWSDLTDEEMNECLETLSGLETGWRDYYSTHPYSREAFVEAFVRNAATDAWEKAGLKPREFAASLSDTSARDLYAQVLLADFYVSRQLTPDGDQHELVKLFTPGKFRGDCNAVSVLSLHLLKSTGGSEEKALMLPGHMTVATETPQGEIYLDVIGENFGDPVTFKPPGYFDRLHKKIIRSSEILLEPWQALSATLTASATKPLLAGNYQEARDLLQDAIELNPLSTVSLYLLGAAEDNMNNEDKARKLFHRAVMINPHYRLAREAEAGIDDRKSSKSWQERLSEFL